MMAVLQCFMHDLCHHNSVNCMVMLIESDVHCMVILIDVHCSLSLSIQDGTTPLIIASLLGHVDVVRVLINAHAHVNQHTKVTELIKAGYSFHSLLFWGGGGGGGGFCYFPLLAPSVLPSHTLLCLLLSSNY